MARIIADRLSWKDEFGYFWHDPAILLCDCGNEVALTDTYGLDNTCDQCGRNYNYSGQEVLHSRDPRVEEQYDDNY